MCIHMAKLCLKPIFSLGNDTNRGRVVALELWRELKLKLDALERVRVRWIDHKCKVNSNEFDEEETICK